VGVALQPTSDQLLTSDLGDGSAGAVSFGANSTLTNDLQATSITVPSGVTLGTGGYRIRCQGTCEVNGIVQNWATNSSISEIGTPGATGTIAGGAPAVSAYSNYDSVSNNGLSPTLATLEGGSGGIGGTAYGGTTSAAIASPTILTLHTGTLSGGASGGAYSEGSGGDALSGAGGGVVLILCAEISGSGDIYAIGGNADTNDNPIGDGNAFAGGGGGGLVIVACYSNNFTGSVYVYGGEGYSNVGSGYTSGDNGAAIIMITS
jgi:hypothetical protein